MTTDDLAPLPVSVRLNQLFTTFHSRAEPEQSTDEVARGTSVILGQVVSADEITALRAGAGDDDPRSHHRLLSAITEHFQVPVVYLGDDHDSAVELHKQLRLLAAARDAGVRHLELRGGEVDLDELIGQLSRLATEESVAEQDQ